MALQFVIKAEDQVSPSANTARSSIYQLDAALKNESATLRQLSQQMKAMSSAGDTASSKFKQLSGAVADQRLKVGALKDQMRDAGGLPKTAQGAGLLESIMVKLTKTLGGAGKSLSALGPYGAGAAAGLGALTVAALATGGAVAYLASQLLSLGVSASESKGDITRSLELLYGTEKAALHTYRVLESLTQDIAISHERVGELADSLIKAGMVNGDRMVAAIGAIGKAEAARKGAGQVLEGVFTRSQQSRMFSISRSELMAVGLSYKALAKEISKGTGMSVQEAELRLRTGGVQLKAGLDALTKVVDSKMGDLATKKLMTVGYQAQRLRDTFGRLFENVNTGALARLLQVLGNMLDESNVSGHALRNTLRSAFDEIAAAAERVAPFLQVFFEGAILMALKLYNALYPVRQAISRMFGGDQKSNVASFEGTVLQFAQNVGAGFELAAKAIAWMIDNASALGRVIKVLIDLTPGIGPAFNAAVGAMRIVWGSLGVAASADGKASGKNVSDGVAVGIKEGTPAVEAAMAAMATKGVAAFDAKMQIKSPSRLMIIRGRYLDEGLAKGVNDNADEPAKAMASAGTGAAAAINPGGVTAQARGGAAGGVVVHVTFAAGSVVVGPGGAPGAVQQTEDALTELMANVLEKANRRVAGGGF
jgi:hypothetical protein